MSSLSMTSAYIGTLGLLYALTPFMPMFLDVVKPLNQSRERKLLFAIEYFVDEQKYYYQILCHEYLSTFFVVDILIAVDSMFMVYVQHVCTLFMILSNQLKCLHIMETEYISGDNIEKLEGNYEKKIYTEIECQIMYERIKAGIKIHKNILSFSELLQSSFTISIACQVVLNVLCISFTGIQLVSSVHNAGDITKYGTFILGQFIHLFTLCLPGQRLLDYSSQMFNDAYAAMWYLFPKKVITLYKLLLLRSSVSCKITAGKFVTMCMETFLSQSMVTAPMLNYAAYDIRQRILAAKTKKILKGIEEWDHDKDQSVQVIPPLIVGIVSCTKYFNAIVNESKMKQLLLHIKTDYMTMMKMPQKVLMERGSLQGRKITIYYSTYIFTSASLYSLMPLLPRFLDVVKPLNQSREKELPYEIEYFVDEQKYYYHILLHEYMAVILSIHILVAVDAMFMVYVQHACTLFTSLSNQLKYLHVVETRYINEEEMERLDGKYEKKTYTTIEYQEMYNKIKIGIQMHKNALSYSELLQSSFTTSLAFQVLFNVICISFTGIQIVIHINQADHVTRYGSLMAGQLVHLFCLCLPGQRLLDYSSQVFNDSYEAMWYVFPKNMQPLYKFLLLKTSVPCKITAGKYIIMCMETFLSVTQTAVSYFTVLSSVR